MIKNEQQYNHTKKKLQELEKDLKTLRRKYILNQTKATLLEKGYIEHIVQLKTEIEEYQK